MALLGEKTYAVRRFAAGSFIDLDWVDGAESTFDIIASLQPVKGRDLQLLPEGARALATHKLYTLTQLNTVSIEGQTRPDVVVTPKGERHVHEVEDWTNHDAPTAHFKYFLLRKPEDSDADT